MGMTSKLMGGLPGMNIHPSTLDMMRAPGMHHFDWGIIIIKHLQSVYILCLGLECNSCCMWGVRVNE